MNNERKTNGTSVPTDMRVSSVNIYTLLVLITLIGIFYYDTLAWLVNSWLNNVYYSHGFIVPIISGFIIWKMRKELLDIRVEPSQTGIVALIVGIILYSIGVMYNARFLSGLSLVTTIFGTMLYIFGWEFVNKIKFPIAFLLLAIPVPFVDIVAPPIQTMSAILATSAANILGFSVTRDGLLLHTPTTTFEVALECSGLKSIISLLTISVIYAFILEGRLLMKYTIVLSSIPLAIIGNVLRIISIMVVEMIYGLDTALNFHDPADIMLFSVALLGLFIVGRCFGRLKFKEIF